MNNEHEQKKYIVKALGVSGPSSVQCSIIGPKFVGPSQWRKLAVQILSWFRDKLI